MNPSKFAACPSCGKALEQADVFDQIAGFPHADCGCGYKTTTAITVEDQLAKTEWQAVQAVSDLNRVVLEARLWMSAINQSNDPPDWVYPVGLQIERIVEAVHKVEGLVNEVAQSVAPLIDKPLGEGPRSGGGEATSGAGAQRKEGVQPPDDSTSVMEVSA